MEPEPQPSTSRDGRTEGDEAGRIEGVKPT